jgi:hypothetical protein
MPAMSSFASGRRAFSTASVLLLLTALAHTAGNWPLIFPGAPWSGALAAMAAERTPLGIGMAPSVLDIHVALVLTMTVLLVALGTINLVVAAGAGEEVLRRVLWIDVAAVGALVALYAFYRVPPPLLTFAVVESVLIAALCINRARVAARIVP